MFDLSLFWLLYPEATWGASVIPILDDRHQFRKPGNHVLFRFQPAKLKAAFGPDGHLLIAGHLSSRSSDPVLKLAWMYFDYGPN